MKKVLFIVILLILIMLVIGCYTNKTIDKSPIGTWSFEIKDDMYGNFFHIWKFNNSNYEMLLNNMAIEKGTYSINEGKIILKPTHLYRNYFGSSFEYLDGLYTIKEYKTLFNDFVRFGLTEEEIDEFFKEKILEYSVSNDTLIIDRVEYNLVTVTIF